LKKSLINIGLIGINGLMWAVCVLMFGMSADTVLMCLLCSALVVVSIYDCRERIIPLWINLFIFLLGAVRLFMNIEFWYDYAAGFFIVSAFLLIMYYITKGKSVGGGDIKLVAVTGLFLGWKYILVAFIIGCFAACIIHPVRMRLFGRGRELALGPYLSFGVIITLWFGNFILGKYLELFAV